jgi:hypothetical protein
MTDFVTKQQKQNDHELILAVFVYMLFIHRIVFVVYVCGSLLILYNDIGFLNKKAKPL